MIQTLAVDAADLTAGFDPTALIIGLVLLFANGFFVAAEIALLAANRAQVEELAARGEPAAVRALKALREISVTFSGAQLGITMCSLGLGAIAEPALASLFLAWLEPLGLTSTTASVLAFVVALSIVVFLHMVVGEMVPKNLALADAERLAMRLSRLFGWYVRLFRP
jgi:CBS domain containing-hemolysin-like protein